MASLLQEETLGNFAEVSHVNIYSKLYLEVYEMIAVCISVWELLYLYTSSSKKGGPSFRPPSLPTPGFVVVVVLEGLFVCLFD